MRKSVMVFMLMLLSLGVKAMDEHIITAQWMMYLNPIPYKEFLDFSELFVWNGL